MNSDKTNRKILNRKDINIETKRKYKGSMKEKEKENIKQKDREKRDTPTDLKHECRKKTREKEVDGDRFKQT